MPKLKGSQIRLIDQALKMEGGYVLGFSNRTMDEHFEEELGISIFSDVYADEGTSKANRLRSYISKATGAEAARVLRSMWKVRDDAKYISDPATEQELEAKYFAIVADLERSDGAPALADAVERFKRDETLDELVSAIERDIRADKPAVALDRLHTYCIKKFTHLLRERDGEAPAKAPLNALAGKYLNPIRRKGVRPITEKIMKSTVEVFELFNGIRNEASLAHDGTLVEAAEARYIFDSVVSLLRFLKAQEPNAFGA